MWLKYLQCSIVLPRITYQSYNKQRENYNISWQKFPHAVDTIVYSTYPACNVHVGPYVLNQYMCQGEEDHDWRYPSAWVVHGGPLRLASYLFPLPGQTAHTEIDSSILAEVCQKLSVSPSDVLAAIRWLSLSPSLSFPLSRSLPLRLSHTPSFSLLSSP